MSNFIVGQDISNFQGNIDWPTYAKNSNFVFMKASEGTGYIDTWFGNNRTQARKNHLPRGYYHFARPDTGNSPEDEANFFCRLIDGDPILVGEVLALDFEVNYGDPVTWCKRWLDTVSAHFGGLKPLIYLNQSTAQNHDWSPVVDAGYGLWIAAYTYDPNNNSAQTGKWSFAAMQQWTDKQSVPGISGVVDGDCFFGTTGQFIDYGFQLPAIIQPQPEVPAPVATDSTDSSVSPLPQQPSGEASTAAEPLSTPLTTQYASISSPTFVPLTMPTTPQTDTTLTQLIADFLAWIKKIFGR